MIYTMGMRFSNEESEQWQEIVELVDTDGIEGIHLWYGEASTSLTILNQMQKMSMIPILFDADLERDFQQRLPIPVPAAKIQPWSSSSRGNLSEECMSTGC